MKNAMAPYEHTHRSVGGAQQLSESMAEKLDLTHEDAQAIAKRYFWDVEYGEGDKSDGGEGYDYDGYGYSSYTSESLPTATTSHPEIAATAMSSSKATSKSTSISSTSSAIPSTTSSISKAPVPVSIVKGLYSDGNYQSSTMPPVQTSTSDSIPSLKSSSSVKALGDVASSTAAVPLITSSDAPNQSSLSPPAHNVLIAAAVIGGFVFIGALIYFILRFMNIDVKSYVYKFTRRQRGSWRPGPYGGLGSDTPPYTTFPGEKRLPLVRKLHTPIVIPSASTAPAPSTQELAHADTKRQDLVRQALQEDPQPFLDDPDPFQDDPDPFQDGPPAYEMSTSHTRQIPHPPRRPSTTYGPDRRTSYLSSLSSGFGDLKIDIPESGPTKPQNALRKQSITDRISRNNYQSRFSHSSWISNPPTPARSRANSRSNRDTVYTAVSEESAPRFRTVNSWVSQQVRRAQRQQDVDREIDNMPEIPSQGLAGNGTNHQRQPSEATESIFGFHPGEQVPIAKGKRVSSKILDRIL